MPGTERSDPHRILGVRPGSSQREVRDAYRRLANELHPDRSGASGAARMAEVNEAYRTLRSGADSAATTTRTTAAGASEWYAGEAGAPPPPRQPVGAARVPWRSMLVFAAIGSVAVVVAAQFVADPEPRRPDNVLSPGSCVEILTNDDAREVPCDGGSQLVVQSLVGFDEQCPPETDTHRDRQGMGWACVSRSPEAGSGATGIVRAPEGD